MLFLTGAAKKAAKHRKTVTKAAQFIKSRK